MINFKRAIIIILAIFYKTSCISFHSFTKEIIINENQWTDKNFIFSDLSKELFKQKKINENWSNFDSDKRIPYFKLKNSRGKILGDHIKDNEKFLVINLENNKKYKWKYNHAKKNLLPSHIAVFEDVENAKKLIGKNIWLNNIVSDTIFMGQLGSSFKKFQKVNVIGVKIYQNSIVDCPIWLEIDLKNDFNSYIRYNGKFKIHSRQNNYFIKDPIKKSWDQTSIEKIMEGKIEYGMNHEQVRASIGNPDIINNTSSRHGVSEQWIYGKNLSNKRYLIFENGRLSSM
ncbi:MAG: hypothetical protein CBC40_02760 [bacterium TMED80]|nr:MAG: hypothetical protein CBC40_02760 [bacterium TMED80]